MRPDRLPLYSRLILSAAVAAFAALWAGSVAAQPPDPPELRELVVRLRPAPPGPDPEGVAAAVNGGGPVSHGLGEGNPSRAHVAISDRAAGRAAEWIAENPDSSLARLQRYIVLRYPENANVEAIRNALSHNPNVESVGYNLLIEMLAGGAGGPVVDGAAPVTPNDGLVGSACGAPETTQWGIHQANLPAAWG